MLDKTNLLFALLHVKPLSVFTIRFGRLLFVPGGLLSSFYHSIILLFLLLSFVFLLFFLSLHSHQGSFCRKLALNLVGDPFLSECHLKKRLHYFFSILLAIPLKTEGVSFRAMEYSPLLGGFAVVLADGRGGFLSADTASFECSVSMICGDST